MLKNFYTGKKILITGHTGLKGAWLTLWLIKLGAKVIGVSSNIPTKPSLFSILNLKNKIIHKKADIRSLKSLKKIINFYKPDIVFHLAAQALIKKSYLDPVHNWETNTLGTLNVLESLRNLNKKCVAIMITSDKSYRNFEIQRGYVETDILGGDDPYSASKASAEQAINSYVKSFFNNKQNKIFISSVRAGNVIGGGDWSEDRLIPDCIKSWSKNKRVELRSPNSTRPWQHVIEVIRGYLILAIKLSKNKRIHGESFNFGPSNKNNFKVINLVKQMKKTWKNIKWKKAKIKNKNFKDMLIAITSCEFSLMNFSNKDSACINFLLKINSNKAKKILNWKCILNFKLTASMVAEWYKSFYQNKTDMYNFSLEQIDKYESLIKKK